MHEKKKKTIYTDFFNHHNNNNNLSCITQYSSIPLGFLSHSPFIGRFLSAQKHLFFLSTGSTSQDVYCVSKQSESVVQSETAILAENKNINPHI